MVNSALQAFLMLQAKRADILVNNIAAASAILKSPEFKNTKIRKLSAMLGKVKFFTFFFGKYPEIAKSYTDALNEVKRNGTYRKLVTEIFS